MDICPITPLGMKCAWGDGKQLMSCGGHILNCALREIYQSLPFIGNEIEDYRCPDFEPKVEVE